MASRASVVITDSWYQGAPWLYLLLPLTLCYACLIRLRKTLYQLGLFKRYRATIPVVVVGNITVGGTGKSPLVAYLVEQFQRRGYRPGVVSRGYGSSIAKKDVREVLSSSAVSEVGDEPLMLKRRVNCPVVVSPTRCLAVQALEQLGCNVVITDDGLQHYALARDIEICVVDGQRHWGNGHLLPMGPLREPLSRLTTVDFIVLNGAVSRPEDPRLSDALRMQLAPGMLHSIGGDQRIEVTQLESSQVHAVAAIGHPERFFNTLANLGLTIERHSFADHHRFGAEDFKFADHQPIIMTEKDAVKCQHLKLANAWYLPVTATFSDGPEQDLATTVINKLKAKGWLHG